MLSWKLKRHLPNVKSTERAGWLSLRALQTLSWLCSALMEAWNPAFYKSVFGVLWHQTFGWVQPMKGAAGDLKTGIFAIPRFHLCESVFLLYNLHINTHVASPSFVDREPRILLARHTHSQQRANQTSSAFLFKLLAIKECPFRGLFSATISQFCAFCWSFCCFRWPPSMVPRAPCRGNPCVRHTLFRHELQGCWL